jgi:hypothetical protein
MRATVKCDDYSLYFEKTVDKGDRVTPPDITIEDICYYELNEDGKEYPIKEEEVPGWVLDKLHRKALEYDIN